MGHWNGEEGGEALKWGGGRWGTGVGRREVGALEWGGGRWELEWGGGRGTLRLSTQVTKL